MAAIFSSLVAAAKSPAGRWTSTMAARGGVMAVGGAVGLGVNRWAGLAIGGMASKIDFRGQGRDSGFAGPKPDPKSKAPTSLSKALTEVKVGDDFESAILKIDKTVIANLRVSMANNYGIRRIQEMLQGASQARAKELRMESGGGPGPTIINNYFIGKGAEEDRGISWPLWLLGIPAALAALSDILAVNLKTLVDKITERAKTLINSVKERFGIVQEYFREKFESIRTRAFTLWESAKTNMLEAFEKFTGKEYWEKIGKRLLETETRIRNAVRGWALNVRGTILTTLESWRIDFNRKFPWVEEFRTNIADKFKDLKAEMLRRFNTSSVVRYYESLDIRGRITGLSGTVTDMFKGLSEGWDTRIQGLYERIGGWRSDFGRSLARFDRAFNFQNTITELSKRIGTLSTIFDKTFNFEKTVNDLSKRINRLSLKLGVPFAELGTGRAVRPYVPGLGYNAAEFTGLEETYRPKISGTGYQLEGGMEEGRLHQPSRLPKIDEVSKQQEGRPKLKIVPKTNVVADTKIRAPIVDMAPMEIKATGTLGGSTMPEHLRGSGDLHGYRPTIVVDNARYPGSSGASTSTAGPPSQGGDLRTSGLEKITGYLGPAANEAEYAKTLWQKLGGWMRGERGKGGIVQKFLAAIQKGYTSGAFGRGFVILMAIAIATIIAWKIWVYKSIPKEQRTPEDWKIFKADMWKFIRDVGIGVVIWTAVDMILNAVIAALVGSVVGWPAALALFGLKMILTVIVSHLIIGKLDAVNPNIREEIEAREMVQRKTKLASGEFSALEKIRGGDFSRESWNMGLRGDQTDFLARGKVQRAQAKRISTGVSMNAAYNIPTPKLSVTGAYNTLSDIIMGGESAAKGYDDFVEGPNWSEVNHRRAYSKISTLSIGNIMEAQVNGILGAVGKYQLIATTLDMAIKSGVLGDKKRRVKRKQFNKETQDTIYKWIINEKRPLVGKFLRTGENQLAAQIEMAKEWASIGMPIDYDVTNSKGQVIRSIKAGQSYYAGVGNNRALIKPSDILVALVNLQQTIAHSAAQSRWENRAKLAAAQPGEGTVVNQYVTTEIGGPTSYESTSVVFDKPKREYEENYRRFG